MKKMPGILVIALFLLPTASAQQDAFQQSLETFDRRADQVRVLVESSRIPEADTLFQSALRTRDQAESAHRQGDGPGARALLDRAFALLVQAENRARGGVDPDGGIARRLEGLLKSLRQNLQDSQRWLRDLEVRNGENSGTPSAQSFLEEQRNRTESLLARAERECADSTSIRCQDLLDRANQFFEQAEQLLQTAVSPGAIDTPAGESRLRDARQFLDKAQSELDQIQSEVVGDNPPTPGLTARIRNVENLIRLGNDRLQEADLRTRNLQQGQSGMILNLFRRTNELAHLALRSIDGGAQLQKDYEERASRVAEIRAQVEEAAGEEIPSVPGYAEGVGFQSHAAAAADSGNYEQALLLLSRAAGAFNNALAAVGSGSGGVNAEQVYLDLKAKYERDYRNTLSSAPANEPLRAGCSDRLNLSRERADQAEAAQEEGALFLALSLLNQAQQILNEAKACLGQSSPKIAEVLDRFQTQFDKRLTAYEQEMGADESPLVSEAKSLRQLSDVQETNGDYEAAVQSVGRGIRALEDLRRTLPAHEAGGDSELLAEYLREYDERAPRVRDRLGDALGIGARELLDQADRMRAEAETSAQSGDVNLGLARIAQAIRLLEQAAQLP